MANVKQVEKYSLLLHISRHACASIENRSSRPGAEVNGETHDWWGVTRRKWNLLVDQTIPEHADLAPHAEALRTLADHRAMAATEWIDTMREGLRLLEACPQDMLHVPYAQLCAEPENMCNRLAEFTGLAPDTVCLDYARTVLHPPQTKGEFPLPTMLERPFHATCKMQNASEANG